MSEKVPDVPAPVRRLCWQQATQGPYALWRCDRVAGHDGLHTWEYQRRQKEQDEELTRLRIPAGNADGY